MEVVESIDLSTPEGLEKANLKEVVCTRCKVKSVLAIMVPVPDDYVCISCMETNILANDAGVLVPWDEKPGGQEMSKEDSLLAAIADYKASYESFMEQGSPIAAQTPLNMALKAKARLEELRRDK
jgi:hypothetical protein